MKRSLSLLVTLSLLLPSVASARIWPDDFLAPSENPIGTAPSEEAPPVIAPPQPVTDVAAPTTPTPILDGPMHRIDFVAALVSRTGGESSERLEAMSRFLHGDQAFQVISEDRDIVHVEAGP